MPYGEPLRMMVPSIVLAALCRSPTGRALGGPEINRDQAGRAAADDDKVVAASLPRAQDRPARALPFE